MENQHRFVHHARNHTEEELRLMEDVLTQNTPNPGGPPREPNSLADQDCPKFCSATDVLRKREHIRTKEDLKRLCYTIEDTQDAVQLYTKNTIPLGPKNIKRLERSISALYTLQRSYEELLAAAKLVPDPNHPVRSECFNRRCYQCSIRDCPYKDPLHYYADDFGTRKCVVCGINDLPPVQH